MVDKDKVNGRTPEVSSNDSTPAVDDVENVNAPGEDWEKWDNEHPEEAWISYVDSDGNPARIPVWKYRELGL